MTFAGMNILAIVAAAVAAWLAGAVWYTTLSRLWLGAHDLSREEFMARQAGLSTLRKAFPFGLSFVAELAMAWILAGVIAHLGPGQVTIRNGIISAAFIWFGFVLTTMAVNNAYSFRRPLLTVIDGGHWLMVLLLMGAIIGAFGV